MLSSQIPGKFNIPFANAAGLGYIRTIPLASQIGIQEGAASLTDGFPPANFVPVGAGGIPPFGQDMNGILKQITQWAQWQAANGPVIYDATFSAAIGGYPKGTILNSVDLNTFWLCLVDNNTTNPDAGGAGWLGFKYGRDAFYAIDVSATPNLITINPTPPIASYTEGIAFLIKIANGNIGPVTINVNGIGVQTVTNRDGTAMVPGALVAGGIYLFTRDATKFQCENPEGTTAQLPGLIAPRTYYVNGTTGSDSNDGLAPTVGGGHGPLLTIQAAANKLPTFNMNGFSVTISVADGTYNQNSYLTIPALNGSGQVYLVGNETSPQNVLLTGINRGPIFFTGAGVFNIRGFTLSMTGAPIPNSGDPGAGVLALGNNVTVNVAKCRFGAVTSAHMSAGSGATINVDTGTITIFGSAQYHMSGDTNTSVRSRSLIAADLPDYVIANPVTFVAFIKMSNLSVSFFLYKTMTGAGFVTGTRYLVDKNSIINSNGSSTYYPGTVAGSQTSGGQYV